MADSNKTYVGVVEDNNDPKRMGRVKVRVMSVHENFTIENIPWATPWKDLTGNEFNIPEIGKIVVVIFDNGNFDNPEFIYSDHYNINLERKLKSLSDSDYNSMKSILFDHKTQIYVNDTEGLKIDHKFNAINIKENGIDLNLKDNNNSINIGDSTANQQAILGNYFIDWLEKFLDSVKSGGLMTTTGPVIPSPSMLKLIIEFKAMRDVRFLSHHVNIVDNNGMKTVLGDSRENDPVYGDMWASSKEENNLTKISNDDVFTPQEGPKKEFDEDVSIDTQLVDSGLSDSSDIIDNSDFTIGIGGNYSGDNNNQTMDYEEDSRIQKLIAYLEFKKYKIYTNPGVLNIVAMRDKDSGFVTNKFDETLFVFYKNDNNKWKLETYSITTVPGFIVMDYNDDSPRRLPESAKILVNGQYVDQCILAPYRNSKKRKCLLFLDSYVHINNSPYTYNFSSEMVRGSDFKITIHDANQFGSSENVNNYAGNASQTFKNNGEFSRFIKLCMEQESIKKTFTYTLCRKSEFENFKV